MSYNFNKNKTFKLEYYFNYYLQMNITDSEILKLKSNMGYLKKDTSRDNQPIQNDTNNNGITESAKSI